ncbi:MAG: chromate transporter [Treponemataceae bacterium]|nr:chromate transporter [Treponemataceae bacterium]
MEIFEVARTFLQIGLISLGGGWSTVGIIRNAVVPRWIDEKGFRELIAIAQSTPGPVALNAATMIGWYHGGWLSAITATLAVVTIPVLFVTIVLLLTQRCTFSSARLNQTLKTTSLAMMLMTGWVLRPTSLDPILLSYALITFWISAFTKINPLWAILGAGVVNILVGYVR